MQQQQPHLLAVPCPAQGHINPMFEFCSRLASSGFFVTFVVALKEEMFPSSTPHHPNLRSVFVPEEPYTVANNALGFVLALERNLKRALAEIVRKIGRDESVPPLVCLLSDVLLVGLHEVAHDFKLCKASLSTFSASWLTIQAGLDLLLENGLLPLNGSSRMVDFIPGLPPISGKHLPEQIQHAHPKGINFQLQRYAPLKNDSWILVNSFDELEKMQIEHLAKLYPRCSLVGPLLPSHAFEDCDPVSPHVDRLSLWKEEVGCLEWLDKQAKNSVVYISVGSLATLSMDQIREVYTGLERSGHPFLWVLRSDTIHSDVELVQNSSAKIVSWAPQLKVLQHSSIAAFVTHCGWNSIIEAVVAGVPVVAWPLLFEQPLNCALAVDHWGIGLRISENSVPNASEVEQAVRAITGTGELGQKCRGNVQKLSAAARDSVSRNGTSFQTLKTFGEDMRRRARTSISN